MLRLPLVGQLKPEFMTATLRLFQHCTEKLLRVADDRQIGMFVLVDFRRINVRMHDFRTWREFLDIARHTVAETHAHT